MDIGLATAREGPNNDHEEGRLQLDPWQSSETLCDAETALNTGRQDPRRDPGAHLKSD